MYCYKKQVHEEHPNIKKYITANITKFYGIEHIYIFVVVAVIEKSKEKCEKKGKMMMIMMKKR